MPRKNVIGLFFQENSVEIINQTQAESHKVALTKPIHSQENKRLINTYLGSLDKGLRANIGIGFEYVSMKSRLLSSQLKKKAINRILNQLVDDGEYFTHHTLTTFNDQINLITLSIQKNLFHQIIKLCKQCRLQINTIEAEPTLALSSITFDDTLQLLYFYLPQKQLLCLCKDKKIQHCEEFFENYQDALFENCRKYKSTHPNLRKIWTIGCGENSEIINKILNPIEITAHSFHKDKGHTQLLTQADLA